MGLIQYVGRYVPDLATVAASLTKKSVEFHWGPDQENSFKLLLQEQRGISRVIAYGHRSLSEVESRYSPVRRQNGRPWELSRHANTLRCIFLVASFA